jgi:DNA-binding PadR family transcriptional regulator
MGNLKSSVPAEQIEQAIFLIRGKKVMLDRNLAKLYGVETRVLNQAVQRNIERFPDDFMFDLTREEIMRISQIVTSSKIKYSKKVYAFSEQGIAMLSSVLRSSRAIQVNIEIMRAFVRLREMLATHKELARKLTELEKHVKGHDQQIQAIFEAIRQLMTPPEKPRKRIGFQAKERRAAYSTKKKRQKK